ncbi:MAG: FecR domain-containing protein [Acidobacteria bacterium]|nr:FecR domain-containing protein [Acidobacteriota bacterium]
MIHKKLTDNKTDNKLEQTLNSIRREKLDSDVVDAAAQRVWAKLAESQESAPLIEIDQIRTCADFQSLISTYLSGKLTTARTILFEDHTRECLLCRKALKEARNGRVAKVSQVAQINTTRSTFTKWLIAAAAILALTLISWPIIERFSPYGSSVYASVNVVEGAVYRVADDNSNMLKAGTKLKEEEKIRTAKDAGAVVTLSDGSLIEMKERSEFYLTETGKGINIHLERGNIIVQANKQNSRKLFVTTSDCLVSVDGTIFSVNSGIKGSRVSVIDGNVQVDYAGQGKNLQAGEQLSTNPSLGVVAIKDEISWSRDAAKYSKLLAALSSVRKEIERVPVAGVRYTTELLDIVPAQTVFYSALPNFSASLEQSYAILQQHLSKNPALQEWWNKAHNDDYEQMIKKIIELGSYLGSEIVISSEMKKNGEPDSPVIISKTKDLNGLINLFSNQKDIFKGLTLVLVDSPVHLSEPAAKDTIYVWVNGDLFAASLNPEPLKRLAENIESGQKAFMSSIFYARIAQVYQEGAGVILAADLEKIIPATIKPGNDKQLAAYEKLGLTSLKHFIAEQKQVSGKTQNRAVLSFNQTNTGITSWVADPGPIGALEFVSPDANVVTGFVIKDPASLMRQLLESISSLDEPLAQNLIGVQKTYNLDIVNDFAAPLGGEFVSAIDGPVIPTPAWKVIFEVYDSAKLQSSLEKLTLEVNRMLGLIGKKGLAIEKSELNGRTFYTLRSLDTKLELNYTFSNGYFVGAASRALVDQALRYRDSGYTLTRSAGFIALLPEDTNANFSGLFYYNLASVVAPIADQIGKLEGQESKALQSLVSSKPTLVSAYAQGDRITFLANGDLGPFSLSPANLLGLPNAMNIQKMVKGKTK